MNRLRFDEEKLYGRDADLSKLEEMFVAAEAGHDKHKRRQLTVIVGEAGAGKSSLADSLNSRVLRGAGFFLKGKVDQPVGEEEEQEPYAAFTMICRNLCDVLLAHRENPNQAGNKWQFAFEDVQTKLRQELGDGSDDAIKVLTSVFPDLTQLFGGNFLTQEPMSANIDIGNQFTLAFCHLMRALSEFGRIVLVMDDLQVSFFRSCNCPNRHR